MKLEITFAQLAETLPKVPCGIWFNVDGRSNYISDIAIWNLVVEKYGNYIVDVLGADHCSEVDEEAHVKVAIVNPEWAKRLNKEG